MYRMPKKEAGLIFGSVIFIAVDQWIKISLVAGNWAPFWINRGIAFSFWPEAGKMLALAGWTAWLWFGRKIGCRAKYWVLAGGISNLLDRWRYGGVVDYINLKVWPVFNLADLAISAGVLYCLWDRYRNQ